MTMKSVRYSPKPSEHVITFLCIDFKTFIDCILALENRKEIPSIYFLFNILDIQKNNHLDDFALRYYFKAIQQQMKLQNQEPIDFVDFSNEIFDMVRPKESRKISFEDLIARYVLHQTTIIRFVISLI